MPGVAIQEKENRQKLDKLILAGKLDSPGFHAIANLVDGMPTLRERHLMVRFTLQGNATLSKTLHNGVRFQSHPDSEQAIDAVLLHEPTPSSKASISLISVNTNPDGKKIMTITKLTKGSSEIDTDVIDVANQDEVPDEDKQILAAIESRRVQAERL